MHLTHKKSMSSWAAPHAPAVSLMAPLLIQRDAPENAQAAATEDASVEALEGPVCLFPRLRPQDEHSAYPNDNSSNHTHVCYQFPFQSSNFPFPMSPKQRSNNQSVKLWNTGVSGHLCCRDFFGRRLYASCPRIQLKEGIFLHTTRGAP